MGEGVKVNVHLVDSKGRAALISYQDNTTLADITSALNVSTGRIGVMLVKPTLSEEQSHPRRLHRVYHDDQLGRGSVVRVVIEELNEKL